MKELDEFIKRQNKIRIIVANANQPGVGGLACTCTLMKHLRELGFEGVFDILICDWNDFRGKNYYNQPKTFVKLASFFIPELRKVRDYTKRNEINTKDFGAMQVSCEYNIDQNFDIQTRYDQDDYVELCFAPTYEGMPKVLHDHFPDFMCKSMVIVQPTNWLGENWIITDSGYTKVVNEDVMRLSVNAKPSLNGRRLTAVEKVITKLCNDSKVETQLIYGLYSDREPTPDEILHKLISAHKEVMNAAHDKKARVLFIPQNINIKKMTDDENVKIIGDDQDKGEEPLPDTLDANTIYFVKTGPLQSDFFEHMVVNLTSLPSVAEGCNVIELLEANGKPFIKIEEGYASRKSLRDKITFESNLPTYPTNNIHCDASEELGGLKDGIGNLIKYLSYSPEVLQTYHNARKEKYLALPEQLRIIFDVLVVDNRSGLIRTKR